MNSSNSYLSIAQDYADRVRVLFAPSGGPASPAELAEQAEQLLPVSKELTPVLAAQLTENDLAVNSQASVRLLALALTDLKISGYLFELARDEEQGISWSESGKVKRTSGSLRQREIEENLQILLGEATTVDLTERGDRQIKDIPTARKELSETIKDTLFLILERASNTSELAFNGLVGLGLNELTQVTGAIGMGIAEILGQADRVSRLYQFFREFLQRAWESLVELLGTQLAQTAADQALDCIEEFNEGRSVREILERFYQTEQTNSKLKQLVMDSQAQLKQFTVAISEVNGLDSAYSQRIDWAEKLLNSLKYLRFMVTASPIVLPQSQLIFASLYIVLAGYVVLVGADYVDSPQLNLLDRVPGVRQVVETNLGNM